MAAGHAAGLLAIERYAALLTRSDSTCVLTRASLAQRRTAARHQHHTAHHNVLVFRIPKSAEQIATELTTTAATSSPSRREAA